MLRITSDGRKLGLDQRIINPNLPDEPTSKVNMCVDNIHRIWEDGHDNKLTQLVFCDLSTPKNSATKKVAKAPAGNLDSPELRALEHLAEKDRTPEETDFTVYDDIREKLVARGIPREQIAFIHEANTEVRKKELFSKVRSGQVRVLMGSTFKMGAGMNVQDRLIALHDLDAPWRPGDLEQRSGRIIRQGNMNPEVHIYRYVTEATFDAYLWQTLENKQKFISQIMTSKSPVRACDDIDETALSYAEIKALCAGDERIKEKMDLDVDVARLKLMKSNHQSQQYRLEDNLLRYFPEQIEQSKGFIAGFEADMKTLAEHPHPTDGFAGMTVRGDVLTDKENAGAALVDAFKEVKGLDPVPVGSYRGFQMSLTLEDFGRDYVLTPKGQMTHRITLGKDPRGNLTRIDNALNGMADRLATVQSKLESLYSQMETAKQELGKPFLILLNSAQPQSPYAQELRSQLEKRYGVGCVAVDCQTLEEADITDILRRVLYEFPLREMDLYLPSWVEALPSDHPMKQELFARICEQAQQVTRISEINSFVASVATCSSLESMAVSSVNLGTGTASIRMEIPRTLFFQILSAQTGIAVQDDGDLFCRLTELAQIKQEYDKVSDALTAVRTTGYGIVVPTIDELTLEEPEIMKQGGRYGVRLKASAPSIHMIRADIETVISPIVGSEKQSEEMIDYLLREFEGDPRQIWESNIFGKSFHELVNEDLQGKLTRMPEDARVKLRETLQRIINEGSGGLICIIL